MLSVGLSVSSEYDTQGAEEIRSCLSVTNDPYPDYMLYIADDMKLTATLEELRNCVKDAIDTDAFETLYLAKIGEGVRLVKQATNGKNRICVLEPPLFSRNKKRLNTTKTLAIRSERQGASFTAFVGLLFIAMVTVAVMYLFRRKRRQ